jgi:hypothetical protein
MTDNSADAERRQTHDFSWDHEIFDSNDARVPERAWAFVESDPGLEGLAVAKRQSELARCLMALEKRGETNPTSLANAGIAMLRARHQRTNPH